MPFIPVPGGAQVEMRYTLDEQACENVFWVSGLANESPVIDLQNIGRIFRDWWVANIKPLQPATIVLREVYVTDQSSASGATWTEAGTLPQAGSGTGQSLPSNCALVVSLRTALRGRSFRGRSYFFPLREQDVVENEVGTDLVTALLTAYGQLILDLVDEDYHLAVCSRFSGGDPRAAGVLTPVQAVTVVDRTIDSQRRRLPGRGR